MPTIRQVAKACGVSPMTVSFVLNNKPGQVSKETRVRVLKTVREMGYRPTAVDIAAENRQVFTLGVVAGVPGESLAEPGYYSVILHAILAAADRLGQCLTVLPDSLLHKDPHQSIRVYCDGRCDGLLVIAPLIGNTLVTALKERGIPMVLVGDPGDDNTFVSADIDNLRESCRAVEYLIDQGHTRIAFLGGYHLVRSASLRRDGYRMALERRGLAFDASLECSGIFRETEIETHVRALMTPESGMPPTALFLWSDQVLAPVMRTLHEMNLRVPEDVSVIGFDDGPLAATIDPPVTTMRQPYREIAIQAVEMLLAQIQEPAAVITKTLLPTELVVRSSVGPPRAQG
ncbi:MAG: LacI family DNA-binding transcriptional regulator [Janthinobacterium lividum]